MDLLVFLVAGALVGWLVEWLIDFFYWRRNISRWANGQAQLQAELGDARAEVGKLHVQVARVRELDQQLVAARAHLEARMTDLARLQTDLDGQQAQNQTLNAQLTQADRDRRTLTDRYAAEVATAQSELGELRAQLLQSDADRQAVSAQLLQSDADRQMLSAQLLQSDADRQALDAQLTQAYLERQLLTDRYDAAMAESQSKLSELNTQLHQADADQQTLIAQINDLQARQLELELEATRSVAAIGVLTAAAAQPDAEPADDLTIIEGIGPKIAGLLDQHGVRTFAQLAETSVDDLQVILQAGGSRFQTANPETWPRQARLAANREWNKLDVLKAQLVAGVRRALEAKTAAELPTRSEAVPEPADDLTILEGIGPKIAELLDQQGIRTFAQLAETSVDDLQAILRAGGSRFQTANPETWPRQARLAANREWNKLDVLKAQLVAGVRRAPEAKTAAELPNAQ